MARRDPVKWLQDINAKRMAAGQCRHCGGEVPCLSEFGDRAVGKRHTQASWRRTHAAWEERIRDELLQEWRGNQ